MKRIRVAYRNMDDRPVNVNSVSVVVNYHESVRSAPIELAAGCSWAHLDIDGAKAVVGALQEAIIAATKETEKSE